MAQIQVEISTDLLQGIFSKNGRESGLERLLEVVMNQVLDYQAEKQIGAQPYERTKNRKDYRNGFRPKKLKTRIGTLELSLPRFRFGKFTTEMFKKYQRNEQALILSMMEMVINGVSTRKVTKVTEKLCGTSFSKSTVSTLCKSLDPIIENFRNRKLQRHYPFVIVDAIYTKQREDNRVRSVAVLIAEAVSEEGKREIIGFDVADSESENSWNNFFEDLKNRGLNNVDFLISDNHKGLVKALHKNFKGSSWQRCQTHFSRNIIESAPKKYKTEIKNWLYTMYNSINLEKAKIIMDEMVEKFIEKAPKSMKILEDGFYDAMSIMHLPKKYRKRLRTTNNLERLNQEIRRRERVIRIFPNKKSVIRLIGALLKEQHEKWISGRKYLDMDEYYESVNNNSNN